MLRPSIIYRGFFGSAGFQSLYTSGPALTPMLCTTLEYHVLVTLPLCVLSMVFHPLWPLAITSLAFSLGVCVAAGAQAALPRYKRRLWSRPLVAMLYFLQPIVRGWARYRGRLLVARTAAASGVRQSFDSAALSVSKQDLRELQYWAEHRIDRLALVAAILQRLEQQGWPSRADVGWGEHDLEVYDSRWCKLQLSTVAEEHAAGKQLLKCRLRPRWSLRAKVAVCSLAALLLVLVGLIGSRPWWHWLLLAPLPLFGWFLRGQERNLQSLFAVFLDDLAKERNLAKVQPVGSEPALRSAAGGGVVGQRRAVEAVPASEIQNSKAASR